MSNESDTSNMSNMSNIKERAGRFVLGVFIGFCLGGWLGRCCNGMGDGHEVTVDTVIVRDTVRVTAPKAVDSTVTGVIRIPIVRPAEPSVPKADIKVYAPNEMDSILGSLPQGQDGGKIGVSDTVWATVPRTQKRYEDSTYTAWVSGYEARLDSINVYQRTVFVTKTQTVTKRNRFGVGLTGGVGYGIINRKPDVFIGVGVTWRIW